MIWGVGGLIRHCALKGEFLVTNLPRGKIPRDPRIPWGSQGDREGTAALGHFTGFFLFDKSYKESNDSAEGLLGCSALIINYNLLFEKFGRTARNGGTARNSRIARNMRNLRNLRNARNLKTKS